MREGTIQFAWREPRSAERFRSGVSLHGHTMHSQECLSFLPRYLHYVPGISQIASYYERAPRSVDFGRAWWTPPLTPASALRLEREQIAGLGLRPMVSLTDHDDIEAGLALGVTSDPRETPVSVEWTVPYERTFFHLGVHNIPRGEARGWLAAMAGYTAQPRESTLPAILDDLARDPGVLIVLNHPFWLEEGVVEEDHRRALGLVLRECIGRFDAFELNGTRPWKENADTIELARAHGRPVISGGDRHACDPAPVLTSPAPAASPSSSPRFMTAAVRFSSSPSTANPWRSESWRPAAISCAPTRSIPAASAGPTGFSIARTTAWLGRSRKSGAAASRNGWPAPPRRSNSWLEAGSARPCACFFDARGTAPVRQLAARLRASVQDLSPERMALLLSVGLVLGVFPIAGCPTLLCLLAAFGRFERGGASGLEQPLLAAPTRLASAFESGRRMPLRRRFAARRLHSRQDRHGGVTRHRGVGLHLCSGRRSVVFLA